MRKFTMTLGLTISLGALAQTAAEEAIILNQELQFLQDSVETIAAAPAAPAADAAGEKKAEPDLESTYFGATESDSVQSDAVQTRKAAPKRRSF